MLDVKETSPVKKAPELMRNLGVGPKPKWGKLEQLTCTSPLELEEPADQPRAITSLTYSSHSQTSVPARCGDAACNWNSGCHVPNCRSHYEEQPWITFGNSSEHPLSRFYCRARDDARAWHDDPRIPSLNLAKRVGTMPERERSDGGGQYVLAAILAPQTTRATLPMLVGNIEHTPGVYRRAGACKAPFAKAAVVRGGDSEPA